MPQLLNSKEQSLLRQVMRCYEEKQFKRGLKSAEMILKKVPRHGETMAMKALIFNGQGKTADAFALAKEALQVDMKSHLCWHVYGLLYRYSKNYEEAIKAYRFALRLEPDSAQIQRDLAILQVHIRDYAGYIQSRTAMLQARPQLRQNWTALAIAHHLAGNLAQAENVLTTYEGTLKTQPPRTDYEHSEAVMYKNTLIAEQGEYQRALEHLESIAKANLDRLAVLELRAEYLEKLGKKEEATKAYRALLERNPDHGAYYESLTRVMDIPEDDQEKRKLVYDEYAEKSPRSDAPRRLPLDFLTGDAFRDAAKGYVARMLDKGVPSTFANLKHLYSDSSKKETLLSVVQEYLDNSKDPEAGEDKTKGKSAALYYLAQHFNYHLSRDLTKAQEYLDQAIAIVPDSTEFHMTKARILKHTGDLQKAAEAMDQARVLDKKDRYINSKTAKYQLRNNETDKALKTMGLFTRPDTPGGPLADLHDMQCVWFLTEDGESYERQGNIGMALKRFHAVQTVYETWQEDQYDFHTFALRKGQVRAYVDLVRWEDGLRQHPTYTRAALNAVSLYLRMHDRPSANGVHSGDDANGEDAAERKKAAKKARKEQQRLEKEAAERVAKQDPNKGTQPTDPSKKVDEDPLGLKLAATTEPLQEAMKFITPMLQFSPKNIDSQLAGFDVLVRRKKYVMALRCLNAARSLDSTHPRVHEQTVQLRHALNTLPEDGKLPEKVAEVIAKEFEYLDANTDLKQYNQEFQEKNKDSILHVLAAARASKVLGTPQAESEPQLIDLIGQAETFEDSIAVLDTLKEWRASQAVIDEAKKKGAEKWPSVTRFS